jgi:hypothetical protein
MPILALEAEYYAPHRHTPQQFSAVLTIAKPANHEEDG